MGVCRYLMVSAGICWYLLESADVLQASRKYFAGVYWHLLETVAMSACICWHRLVFAGDC